MASLTVREANIRASSIRVTSYDVELDLTRGDTEFGSRSTIEFDSLDRQSTWVDIQPATLISVRLNGRPVDIAMLYEGRLHLGELHQHNDLVVEALMSYSHDGEGLHRAVDPEDKQAYIYAMAFLDAAPRVFGCFDQPDLKAPVRMRITAPDDWVVLGNGRATKTAPGRWDLAETKPLATYFATLVAGPYHSITSEHDGVLLGLHCRQSLRADLDKDAEELFTVTAQAFDEFHRLFGIRYPFGDYHQVFCPEFNAGAMENPGCVIHSDTFVFKAQPTVALRGTRAAIVVHEMAHQWFGDLVTMKWWDDLWLNESFADYMGYRVTNEVTKFDEVWAEFAFIRKSWGMAADQRASTHPIAGNGARDTQAALSDFDGISYCKGAAALRQLNKFLGDDAFLAGVTAHLNQHAFGNARLDDLLQAWDDASDSDVRAWAGTWLRTSGIDTLTVGSDSSGQPVIRRANGSSDGVARQHAITVTWFGDSGQVEHIPITIDSDETSISIAGYDGSGLILPDSGDDTWAKIVLDPRSFTDIPRVLAKSDDVLARAVIWGSLREALLDSRLSPNDYLSIVEGALPFEADLAVEAILRDELRQGGTSTTSVYLGALPENRERVSRVASAIMQEAEPSSLRQLIAARILVNTTHDVELLQSWLGGAGPDGLLVDEDLRWRLTRKLCEHGILGLQDIEAESQRDPSSQGALAALAARAALPDPKVKAEVWQTIWVDQALSNYELFALAEGFFRPGQNQLTAPYVTRYFDDLSSMADTRGGMMAERLAALLFPRHYVEAPVLEKARRCLESSRLTEQLRRPVADHTDDLGRALRSRETFGW
jgi:aminopeptidase N